VVDDEALILLACGVQEFTSGDGSITPVMGFVDSSLGWGYTVEQSWDE
jgi:hypothetical protein